MSKVAKVAEEDDEQATAWAIPLAALVVARLIGTKQIDPAKIRSKKKFLALIDRLGRTDEYAFEFHIDHLAQRLNTIRLSLENGDPQSAVVLLHTLIESEVNTVLRLYLRVRGFSNSAITTAIGGIDLKSKLDVMLPVLGVQPSARIHQLASESHRIRNAIVHFKATPTLVTDEDTHDGDHDASELKAKEFFRRNTISSISKELEPFVDVCASRCPELIAAHALLERF